MTTRPGYIWSGTEWIEIGQSAVVAPVAYQASAPSTPATGDIWIDSDDEVPSVDSTLYYRWTKTMSGGETSLSGTDNNSLSLRYTPGYESVFINGVLQVRNLDYTATSGSTIAGLTALASNDVVMVESIVAYSVGDTYTQSTLNSMFSPITTTGLVLLNTTTFTTASTVSINNCFSSDYTNYRILISATGSNSGANGNIRLRVGGVDNSAAIYKRQFLRAIDTAISADYSFLTETQLVDINSSYEGVAFADVFNPALPVKTRILANFSASRIDYIGLFYTNHDTATAYDGFSFIPSSGTATGTIKVYGYK